MSSNKRHDVIIVGAGMAGAALAMALRESGLSLAIVEARDLGGAPGVGGCVEGPGDFDHRVSSITPNSQSFLERIGAWQRLHGERLCPYREMTVWDADGTGEIHFDAAELDAAVLGHIVENRHLTRVLLDGLSENRDLHVYCPASLKDIESTPQGGVDLELEGGARLSARLLVAADGGQSLVRRLADFRTRDWEYGHNALVTTVETELFHGGTAYQRFLSSGPLAFLPLPDVDGRHYCSIVWSAEPEVAEALLAMDDAEFLQALGEAFEFRLGALPRCSARFAFPLRQCHAVDYVKPGIALVGDAAHTIHPLAGQGINLGLQDVATLADLLVAAAARGRNPGQLALLRRYQRQRKGENLLMMAAMDGFKGLFGARQLPVRWLRNQGLHWVNRAQPLKQRLMRHAMGVR